MDEFEDVPDGDSNDRRRFFGPLDDRILVGLAALVLVAGLLIGASNLLKGLISDEPVSGSAIPMRSGTFTPRPTPTPRPFRELSVVPTTPLPAFSPEPDAGPSDVWLELTATAPVMTQPDVASIEIDRLPAGSVIAVVVDSAHPGWVKTTDLRSLGYEGWIAIDGGSAGEVGVLHAVKDAPRSGEIMSVWATSQGFVAEAVPPWWPPSPYDPWHAILISSSDGEQWQVAEGSGDWPAGEWMQAEGPSGLLGISGGFFGAPSWVWESSDGLDWQAFGTIPAFAPIPRIELVGSDLGYVTLAEDVGSRAPGYRAWFSRDGIVWQEGDALFPQENGSGTASEFADARLLAVEDGFIAWGTVAAGDVSYRVAFSPNGRWWEPVEMEDVRAEDYLQLGAAGSALLGVAVDGGGGLHAWIGDLSAGAAMRLQHDPAAEAVLGWAREIWVMSDGHTAYALGRAAGTGAARLWQNDGQGWREIALPDLSQIGPDPRLGAVGPKGLVVISSHRTAAGSNPVFWHLRSDGRWVAEAERVFAFVPDPTESECGPLPATALAIALLPDGWGPACFADEPMTFTAWAEPCVECRDVETVGTPAWLMRPAPDLWLRPARDYGAPSVEAILAPGVAQGLSEDHRVRVTGHYADRASGTCAWAFAGPDAVREWAVPWCRQHFVITAIETVEGA